MNVVDRATCKYPRDVPLEMDGVNSKIFPKTFSHVFEHWQILALELLNRRHKSSALVQVLASIEDESCKDKSINLHDQFSN